MNLRAGIDLGGTKIQAVVVDDATRGARRGPPPDADEGGPADVAAAMADGAARRRRGRGPRDRGAARRRRRLAGRDRRGDRDASPARATCPAGRAPTRSPPTSASELGAPVALGNDVQVATDAEFELGAGPRVPLAARRLLGHGRRRRDRARRQAVGRPRRRRRDRPRRWSDERRPAAARAGAAAAWRPTPAAARWRRGARELARRAQDRRSSRSWRSAAATG